MKVDILGFGSGGVLQVRHTPSFLGQLLIGSQGGKDLCLAQREKDIGVILGVGDNQVLNLRDVGVSLRDRIAQELGWSDLIPPQQGIPLLAFGLVPDLQELLRAALALALGLGAWCEEGQRPYLDAPLPDLVGTLLCIRPVERRTQGPDQRIVLSSWANI